MEQELITPLPSTLTIEEQEELRAEMERKRLEVQVACGRKGQYIKSKVLEQAPLWWDIMYQLGTSGDTDSMKLYIQEYNKIQGKIIPTEITGKDGDALTIEIIDYAQKEVKMIEEVNNETT
jgi:hypothetical protein